MRNDARAHGVLSEPSVSLHIHAHDRKGDRREEIGERKGREGRVETSHHVVAYVTRGARGSAPIVAPSPVTTPDAMMSLTAIEHLDFEPEVPCEHSRHRARHADESAAFLVQVIGFCHLGGGERYALCRSGYALSWRVGVLCPVCRSPFTEPGQEPPLRIVQVLR